MMRMPVCVVDDDEEIRECLESLLLSVGFAVKTFSLAGEFLAFCETFRPGCLLLDVRMPVMGGLLLQDELIARGIEVPIIFLSGHADVPTVITAMKKGACDFLLKPFSEQRVVDAVCLALDRSARLQQDTTRRAQIRTRFGLLSSRERDILERLKDGQSPKQIALERRLSRKTVDAHLARIRAKMEVESTAELRILAQNLSEVMPHCV